MMFYRFQVQPGSIHRWLILLPLVLTLSACSQLDNRDPLKTTALKLTRIQLLQDGVDGNDGLNNARFAILTPDLTQVLVTSADDNSLAVFDVDQGFNLSFNRIFQNGISPDSNKAIRGLTGANKLVILKDGSRVFVQSFYDSAVVVFKRELDGEYSFNQALSDGVDFVKLFGESPLAPSQLDSVDHLGLFGAYDLAISDDNRQLLVASTKSNGLTIFAINCFVLPPRRDF